MTTRNFVISIFSWPVRFTWGIFVAITILSEVTPVPVMIPLLHYGVYTPIKVLLFAVVGFLTPLAFFHFNLLNRGIAFAILSAAGMEALQVFLGLGHRFHWYELLAKLAMVFLGFVLGLNGRHERRISWGAFAIVLVPA